MLDSEDQPPSSCSILITDEAEIRRLNHVFRGIDQATDVLSFPSGEGPEADETLGDIAICAEIADLQAREHSTDFDTEVACLAVHGGLHLLGFTHENEADREAMQDRMLSAVRKAGYEPMENWGSTGA